MASFLSQIFNELSVKIVMFWLVYVIYDPFWLSHQEDDAAGGLCSEFESDLRRKL